MDFKIHCECGESITVPEGAAGTSRVCRCGRSIAVPSLTEMRVQAGLPPQPPNPLLLVPLLCADGKLPSLTSCVNCHCDTKETAIVTVDCEISAHDSSFDTKGSGSAAIAALFLLIGWIVILREARQTEERPIDHGGSRFAHCPVRICRNCRIKLFSQSPMWKWVIAVQVGLAILIFAALTDWGALLLLTAAFTWWLGNRAQEQYQSRLKKLLAVEPIYEQLLVDFPHAKVAPNVD